MQLTRYNTYHRHSVMLMRASVNAAQTSRVSSASTLIKGNGGRDDMKRKPPFSYHVVRLMQSKTHFLYMGSHIPPLFPYYPLLFRSTINSPQNSCGIPPQSA
jgi:hypothetical protein